MPRKARILVPYYPHHIVQRGHNRKVVFLADEDYQFYLDNLKEFRGRIQGTVYLFPGTRRIQEEFKGQYPNSRDRNSRDSIPIRTQLIWVCCL